MIEHAYDAPPGSLFLCYGPRMSRNMSMTMPWWGRDGV